MWLYFLKFTLFNLYSISLQCPPLHLGLNLIDGFHTLYCETKFCCTIQADFELEIILPSFPKCLCYKLWACTTMPGSFTFFKPLFSEKDCFEHRRLIQQFSLKGLWVAPMAKAMACAKKQGCEYADSYNKARYQNIRLQKMNLCSLCLP